MKNKKSSLLKLTKESPDARKKRVSSGIKLRAAVIPNKRKQTIIKEKFESQDL